MNEDKQSFSFSLSWVWPSSAPACFFLLLTGYWLLVSWYCWQGEVDEKNYSKISGGGSDSDTEANMCTGNSEDAIDIIKTYLKVKKRFPTLSHMSDVGIITDHERKIIEDIDLKCIQVDIKSSLKIFARLVWSQQINRSLFLQKSKMSIQWMEFIKRCLDARKQTTK